MTQLSRKRQHQTTVQLAGSVEVDVAGASDVGQRDDNQDQYLIAELRRGLRVLASTLADERACESASAPLGLLLAVADGMGGHEDGARASALAATAVSETILELMPWYFRQLSRQEDDLVAELVDAVASAASRVQLAAGRSERPMGTTLTLAYLVWPLAYVVHVGDSRCYLAHDGELTQVTIDHTLGAELRKHGIEHARYEHVLSRALGGGADSAAPAVYRVHLRPGDALLLCSDGLSGPVADDELSRLLSGAPTAGAAAQDLVDAAVAQQGRDNITAVVARFGDVSLASASEGRLPRGAVAKRGDEPILELR